MLNKYMFLLCMFIVFGSKVYAEYNDELILEASNAYSLNSRAHKGLNKIFKNAKAVVIFPSIKKVGFLLGGMLGDGIMVELDNGSITNISYVQIAGGSAGLQVGYNDSAFVMFLMRRALVEDIKTTKLVFKADMALAFLNFNSEASKIKGDIIVATQNEGMFAGVSLDAAVISLKGTADSFGYAYDRLFSALMEE